MALFFAVVLGASTVASTLTVTRGFLVAFLDHSLRGAPQEVWSDVRAPTDVLVEVYPLKR